MVTYSQIYKMKLPHLYVLFAIFSNIPILNCNGEDSMWTGTLGIHCSCSHHPCHTKHVVSMQLDTGTGQALLHEMFHFCVNTFKKVFIYHFKRAQLLLSNSFPFIIYNPWHFTWNHISATDTVALYSTNKPAPEQGYSYSNIKHGLVWNLEFPQVGTLKIFIFWGTIVCTLPHWVSTLKREEASSSKI